MATVRGSASDGPQGRWRAAWIPLFFRVEHDLLRSESFKALGGSAIKVYLVIGLYADFGTGWAYPSIRTIAKQAGLSRQTVLAAIDELTQAGLLATNKSRGRSTAYRVHPRGRRRGRRREAEGVQILAPDWPTFFRGYPGNRSRIFRGPPPELAQNLTRRWPNSSARAAPRVGPNENQEREKTRTPSRSRERRSGSRPTAGSRLLSICRNC